MLDTSLLPAFVAASLVVLLIPGPGVLYVVTCSLSRGTRAGFASVLGLSAGALVHVAAATAGLSAILLVSATAFSVIKLLGAAYLVYLGLRALLKRRNRQGGCVAPRSASRLFGEGAVISVLNPKIALFFLAFLPQFVNPALGTVSTQVLLLGLLYIGLALVSDGLYAVLAGRLRGWFDGQTMDGPLPRYASAGVYLGLGVGLALSDRR